MELHERLKILFGRIANASACSNAQEALELISRLTESVEEELSGMPKIDPPPIEPTGRMYPPQADYVFPQPDGSILARTRKHRIVCGTDGSITIIHVKTKKVEIAKPGGAS
jgi:hypothetical protein